MARNIFPSGNRTNQDNHVVVCGFLSTYGAGNNATAKFDRYYYDSKYSEVQKAPAKFTIKKKGYYSVFATALLGALNIRIWDSSNHEIFKATDGESWFKCGYVQGLELEAGEYQIISDYTSGHVRMSLCVCK